MKQTGCKFEIMNKNLTDFPANIIKGHGRNHLVIVLFEWADLPCNHAVDWLNKLAELKFPTSANIQKEQTDSYKENVANQEPLVTFGLSSYGLSKLQLSDESCKLIKEQDQMGYKMNYQNGNQYGFDQDLVAADGFLMIAHDLEDDAQTLSERLIGLTEPDLLFESWVIKKAYKKKSAADTVIGPLDFADGISQPDEAAIFDLTAISDPFMPGNRPGSMMSLLKLKTNRSELDAVVENVGKTLFGDRNLTPTESETVNSLIVGRNRAGVPRAKKLSSSVVITEAVNNFRYDRDKRAHLCPYAAHIRSVNQRPDRENTNPRIVRRGMPYKDADEGLYFISYQNDKAALVNLYVEMGRSKDHLMYKPSAASRWILGSSPPIRIKVNGMIKEVKIPTWEYNIVDYLGENYFYVPPVSFCKEIKYEAATDRVYF